MRRYTNMISNGHKLVSGRVSFIGGHRHYR